MRLRKVPEYRYTYVPVVAIGLDYALPAVNGVDIVHLRKEVAIEVVGIGRADHVVRKTDELSDKTATS